MLIKISSRQSDLAKLQSYSVGKALQSYNQELKTEYIFKQSLGDINLIDPLWKMPEKGVFTEDFYNDLINENTDLVVHSWKDLPVEDKADSEIYATLPRADQRDLLLVKKDRLDRIKKNQVIKIYSSSPRRAYNIEPFLKNYLPFSLQNISFVSVRGNIPTRLSKYKNDHEIDGIILAKAAIDRLLSSDLPEMKIMQNEINKIISISNWMVLPLSENPNAAAQGALAIEIKKERSDLKKILNPIHDSNTFENAIKERQILSSYGGGCHQKIGVAVLKHTYGNLTIIRGLTEQSIPIEKLELTHEGQKNIFHKFSAEQIWSTSSAQNFFDHSSLPWEADEKTNLFISKSSAISTDDLTRLKNFPVLWTAGNQTWKKLAQLGLWINGSNESFGEDFPMQLNHLCQEKKWTKLTHKASSAMNTQSEFAITPTYQITRNSNSLNIKNQSCFYWNSSSLFFAAIEEYPEIINSTHCCGLGNTAKNLQRYLDQKFQTNTLWSKLFVFLNQEQWRNYVTKPI